MPLFCSLSSYNMHIPRWFIWLLLYAAATFAWIVYFEYGHDEQAYRAGAQTEWDRIWNTVSGWVHSWRAA
jgi:hypothetical protein